MRPSGGLKLALEAPVRDDRQVRFARVAVSDEVGGDDIILVTDARGRLRYRLPDGEYRLRVAGGEEMRFVVHDHRWTAVRLRLSWTSPEADFL